MLFINFKTYEQGTGGNALDLIKIIEEISHENSVKIVPVLQAADIKEAVQVSKLEIWVQNIDPIDYGAHTGSVLPEAVKEDGAVGTFLNHSEHKFKEWEELVKADKRSKEVDLKTLIFASDMKELGRVLKIKPTFAAYEPPELVGSTKVSVAQAKPDVISKAAVASKEAGIPLIVGAGIHSEEDVRKSVELGAVGVALATDVVKAKDPRKELLELVQGLG
jgi:triosephosphate isomerase